MSTEVEKEEVVESPDIHFQPLVSLPIVVTKTFEEEEEELLKLRAKLFRFDTSEDPPQWKERGVGDVKLLKNKKNLSVRLLMRRDKTHKICANHILTKEMTLLSSAGSDRAWVWNVLADFADEEAKKEQLAIRFKNAEVAQQFKEKFEHCQSLIPDADKSIELVDDLKNLTVSDSQDDSAVESGVKDADTVAITTVDVSTNQNGNNEAKAGGENEKTVEKTEVSKGETDTKVQDENQNEASSS